MYRTLVLTDRQLLVVYAALCYAHANSDDLNDTFANYTENDYNLNDEVFVGGEVHNSFSNEEFMPLLEMAHPKAEPQQ